ncbi:hypothetical protein KGA65_19810 [Ideonella sp. B7]|uniref:hypothetical protein n=1 Tax=Ideonella benzenivorans TaxID=2831643 RepID=UPI001CEDC6F2|nr:hypothetical protein [Ideonella benzenivorans]MCA6218795.1 hypothetical protein [Ideonella benzenivorans]
MVLRLLRGGLAALWMLGMLVGCGGGRAEDPTLQLNLSVDGSAASADSASGTTTLQIQSGQTVTLDSNISVAVVESPGQATLNSLTKTSTSWVGLVSSAVEDDVTLQITSRDYPDQKATVVLHVTPTPLAINVLVDGVTRTATAVGNGDDYTVSIQSGQTVALQSSVALNLSGDFGDARVANRVVSKTGWQGTLTSAVNTEVTFTATVDGDSSRSATVHVQITATPLQVSVMVDGVTQNAAPVLAGESYTLTISSGQQVALHSAVAMVVDESLQAASKTTYTKTATDWSATLTSASATEATLAVKSNTDPTLMATIHVQIDPKPLAVTVSVDGTLETDTAVTAGQTHELSIASGQQVTLDSSIKVNFASSLGAANASGFSKSSTEWQANLSAGTATTVTLTATAQGDSTRVVTILVHVAASPLQVGVAVNGVAVTPAPLLAGQATTVNMNSGQSLTLNSNVSFQVDESLGTASKSAYTKTANTWSATLSSSAPTVLTLTAKSAADSTQAVTINVVLDQIPLTVNLQILTSDGSTVVQTDTATAGDVKTYSIPTGYRVAVGSPTLPINVAADFGDGLARYVNSTNHSWNAMLVSGSATEAVLNVTPQGATTGGLTLKFDIVPKDLSVDVRVNGLALAASPFAAGDDVTILVSSGDLVALASDNNTNIAVSSVLNGLTEASVTKTSTAYTVALTNGTGSDQTAVYTITSASDATAKVTLRITVRTP